MSRTRTNRGRLGVATNVDVSLSVAKPAVRRVYGGFKKVHDTLETDKAKLMKQSRSAAQSIRDQKMKGQVTLPQLPWETEDDAT